MHGGYLILRNEVLVILVGRGSRIKSEEVDLDHVRVERYGEANGLLDLLPGLLRPSDDDESIRGDPQSSGFAENGPASRFPISSLRILAKYLEDTIRTCFHPNPEEDATRFLHHFHERSVKLIDPRMANPADSDLPLHDLPAKRQPLSQTN